MGLLVLVAAFLGGMVAETSLGWGVKIKQFINSKLN